jgi:two-component system, NarL family, nitrate/nitrite response regulator NarL
MTSALRRSKYRISVVDTAIDSYGVRGAFDKPGACIDIALISCQLRDGPIAGLNLMHDLRALDTSLRVIALLNESEQTLVVEAFRAGASGILTREQTFESLCKCIHVVFQGQVWASSQQIRYALTALAASKQIVQAPVPQTNLTQREEGVVRLVAAGLTNRDISRHLNLSENTVRNYLFRIFNKVGTSNRLELALYAMNRRVQ